MARPTLPPPIGPSQPETACGFPCCTHNPPTCRNPAPAPSDGKRSRLALAGRAARRRGGRTGDGPGRTQRAPLALDFVQDFSDDGSGVWILIKSIHLSNCSIVPLFVFVLALAGLSQEYLPEVLESDLLKDPLNQESFCQKPQGFL